MPNEVVQPNDAKVLYDFLHSSMATCIDLAGVLRCDTTHKWHVNLVSLYGSILELSHSIQVLADGDSPVGIPILLRSMLEAFVDIRNLEADRTYGYHMDAAYLEQWIKVLEEAEKGDNPYLKGMSEFEKFDDILSDYRTQLEELKKKGFSALSHFKKFEKSNQVKEYRSIYNFLCCDAHNNMRSLVSRHVYLAGDQPESQIQFFAPFNLDSSIQHIALCIGVLIDGTEIIHKALNSPKLPDVELLAIEFSEIIKRS